MLNLHDWGQSRHLASEVRLYDLYPYIRARFDQSAHALRNLSSARPGRTGNGVDVFAILDGMSTSIIYSTVILRAINGNVVDLAKFAILTRAAQSISSEGFPFAHQVGNSSVSSAAVASVSENIKRNQDIFQGCKFPVST
ncbi:hypothetical protein BT69DRAFT_571675 [Atractiella rhizophila]|nr:hypothetical protein BT69DRAFT_571675 [Atractiella rhizophila]